MTPGNVERESERGTECRASRPPRSPSSWASPPWRPLPSAAGVELADDLVPGLPQSHPDLCRSVLEPALAGADRKEPVELIGRIYTRERALLVGPDERGASLKFTFGLEPKDNQEKDKKLASLGKN